MGQAAADAAGRQATTLTSGVSRIGEEGRVSQQPEDQRAHGRTGGGREAPGGGRRRLDPRMEVVWTVQAAIGVAVVVLMVLAAEIVTWLAAGTAELDLAWPTGLAAAVVAAVGGLAAWRLPRLTHRRWSFELAPDALELRHGVVQRVHSAIPYHRVQYIDIKQGPIERALKLSRLVVHTAAAATDAEIPGIASAEAESLRRTLLERAGVGDAV